MRAWLVRAGRNGERESLALEQGLAVVGWDKLPDLAGVSTKDALLDELVKAYPDERRKTLLNWQNQLWAFLSTITVSDLVTLPLKGTPAVAIGRVTGGYQYREDLPSDARHTRPVEWERPDVPRTAIEQDLRYSLGAFLTVCEIKRHDAVRRLEALAKTGEDPGWTGETPTPGKAPVRDAEAPSDEEATSLDIQQYAADQISDRIKQQFPEHEMARLIQAIFAARGLVTFLSPEGPDGGVDVLVGSGPLGMDSPKICIQVKSSSTAMDVRVVRELQGVVGRLSADQGLLVAWGGLTRAAEREVRQQFFQVRVWNSEDVLRELIAVYDKLPGDIRAQLPLKQVWTLVEDDETS